MSSLPFVLCLPREMGTIFPCGAANLTGALRPTPCALLPLRFFSSAGLGSLLIGLFIASYVFVEKFFMGHPVGDRAALLTAIFFMVLGVQTASVGLLGEIITFTHGRQRKEYTIEKLI